MFASFFPHFGSVLCEACVLLSWEQGPPVSAAAIHHLSHIAASRFVSISEGPRGCWNSFCQAIRVPSSLTAALIFPSAAKALMKTSSWSRGRQAIRGPKTQAKFFHVFIWASFFLPSTQRFCQFSLALHDIFLLLLLSFLLHMSVQTLSSTKGDLHTQTGQKLINCCFYQLRALTLHQTHNCIPPPSAYLHANFNFHKRRTLKK